MGAGAGTAILLRPDSVGGECRKRCQRVAMTSASSRGANDALLADVLVAEMASHFAFPKHEMRSHMPTSLGNSDEMRMIAMPCRASSAIIA